MSETAPEASLRSRLEAEYDLDHGFLGQLRQGQCDPMGLDRLLRLLRPLDFGEATRLNRRMVAVLWMIPAIMTWQLERVAEQRGDIETLRRGVHQVQEILASPSILGTP
jgi:hypothetical protein